MNRLLAASIFLIVDLGCKHPQTSGSPPAPVASNPCPVIGRVLLGPTIKGPSASFCEDRILGPTINLTRQPDGTWTGWIYGESVWLAFSAGKLESPTLHLNIDETGEGTEVHGSWYRELIQIRVSPSEVFVRTPKVRVPIWLRRAPDGSYGEGRFAQGVRFEGVAAELHPPEPQFTLAMLSAF